MEQGFILDNTHGARGVSHRVAGAAYGFFEMFARREFEAN
jgi:hypothetical protein